MSSSLRRTLVRWNCLLSFYRMVDKSGDGVDFKVHWIHKSYICECHYPMLI
ncbi:hypothetical protein BH11BAC6_BH11BAC6_04580 [soil metagenome]